MREATSRDGPYVVRTYERGTTPAKRRRPQRPKPNYARRRRNAALALGAVILLIVVGLWYAGKADEIRNGVWIGEVNVGGMTREEARAAVERHAADAFAVAICHAGTAGSRRAAAQFGAPRVGTTPAVARQRLAG